MSNTIDPFILVFLNILIPGQTLLAQTRILDILGVCKGNFRSTPLYVRYTLEQGNFGAMEDKRT